MSRGIEIIPWQDRELWTEMELSLLTAVRNVPAENASLLSSLADTIAAKYESIDETLAALCGRSCPSCEEVCCRHATVWYDFRDVLFSYFYRQILPFGQIRKTEDGKCMHLEADGCRLTRVERPFICTWYVCPPQKRLLDIGDKRVRAECATGLAEMQRIRKRLEDSFCRCLCK